MESRRGGYDPIRVSAGQCRVRAGGVCVRQVRRDRDLWCVSAWCRRFRVRGSVPVGAGLVPCLSLRFRCVWCGAGAVWRCGGVCHGAGGMGGSVLCAVVPSGCLVPIQSVVSCGRVLVPPPVVWFRCWILRHGGVVSGPGVLSVSGWVAVWHCVLWLRGLVRGSGIVSWPAVLSSWFRAFRLEACVCLVVRLSCVWLGIMSADWTMVVMGPCLSWFRSVVFPGIGVWWSYP